MVRGGRRGGGAASFAEGGATSGRGFAELVWFGFEQFSRSSVCYWSSQIVSISRVSGQQDGRWKTNLIFLGGYFFSFLVQFALMKVLQDGVLWLICRFFLI